MGLCLILPTIFPNLEDANVPFRRLVKDVTINGNFFKRRSFSDYIIVNNGFVHIDVSWRAFIQLRYTNSQYTRFFIFCQDGNRCLYRR